MSRTVVRVDRLPIRVLIVSVSILVAGGIVQHQTVMVVGLALIIASIIETIAATKANQ